MDTSLFDRVPFVEELFSSHPCRFLGMGFFLAVRRRIRTSFSRQSDYPYAPGLGIRFPKAMRFRSVESGPRRSGKMQFRWVAILTIWTFLSGPILAIR